MEKMENSIIASSTVKKKYQSENLQIRLFNRENGIHRRECEYTVNRKFYQNIFPNLTIVNISKPACFLRKFTPDGKYIIAFSYDQKALEVYSFNGISAASELLQSCGIPSNNVKTTSANLFSKIRDLIFYKIFTLKYSIRITTGQLNRECSLFTKDGRYIIVGAANPISYYPRSSLYTSNEFLTLTSSCNLEEYIIYLIDIVLGKISDSIILKNDKIILSHNQGIYLYNNTLAILSIFSQTIHIYQINNGKFKQIHKIGRFCSQFESEIYNMIYPSYRFSPLKEVTINSLKHRVLAFLFKAASKSKMLTNNTYDIQNFFKHFERFRNLKMWKMQLLDEDNLLLLYTNMSSITQLPNIKDTKSSLAFFVFYNISESKILNIYDSASAELLKIFENFCDYFRNGHVISDIYKQFPSSSPNNSLYSKNVHQKCKKTIQSAKGGGVNEAIRRILAQLPISSQSYSQSPYLDLDLFAYDEKYVSCLERPKTIGEFPLRFFARDSGIFKFCISVGMPKKGSLVAHNEINDRHLVAFSFHPYEPFAVSVQRINTAYIVNFHIHNETSTVIY